MLKEADYKEKFEMLHPWLIDILEQVKRDLKNEHWKIDKAFCKRYFLGKHPQDVQMKEMADAYYTDITQGNVGLGEFIASRWLLKHTDIYGFFEEHLKAVDPHFEELNLLNEDVSFTLMHASIKQFGALKTYLFSVLNSVVFPESVYVKLRALATEEAKKREELHAEHIEQASIQTLQERHARETKALQERHEKKLSGLQKKYLNDMESLKKQIRQLQKKCDSYDSK